MSRFMATAKFILKSKPFRLVAVFLLAGTFLFVCYFALGIFVNLVVDHSVVYGSSVRYIAPGESVKFIKTHKARYSTPEEMRSQVFIDRFGRFLYDRYFLHGESSFLHIQDDKIMTYKNMIYVPSTDKLLVDLILRSEKMRLIPIDKLIEGKNCDPVVLDSKEYKEKMKEMSEQSVKIHKQNIEYYKKMIEEYDDNIAYNTDSAIHNETYGFYAEAAQARAYIEETMRYKEDVENSIATLRKLLVDEVVDGHSSVSNSAGVTYKNNVYIRVSKENDFNEILATYAHEVAHCSAWRETSDLPSFLEEGITDYLAREKFLKLTENPYSEGYPELIKIVEHLLRFIEREDIMDMYTQKDTEIACGAWEELSDASCSEIMKMGGEVILSGGMQYDVSSPALQRFMGQFKQQANK